MKVNNKKLKKYLTKLDLISGEKFDELVVSAGDDQSKLEELLISKGFLKEEDLPRIKAHIMDVGFIDLSDKTLDRGFEAIPELMARSQQVVMYEKKSGVVKLAMRNPSDLETINFIEKKTKSKALLSLTTKKSIKSALEQYQTTLDDDFQALVDGDLERKDPEEAAEQMSVVRVVDTLIRHAIIRNASDIHIEPQEEEGLLVRYRIDGMLRDAKELPEALCLGVVARIKVLSNLKLDEHRVSQDGRFRYDYKNNSYSIRVSVLPVSGGEKVVLRILSQTMEGLSLEELGFRKSSLQKVQENINRPNGMILVTGPTGSGKTTTLYSIMSNLNTPEVNISTIEDPIEYQLPRINQTQVKPQIGFTFSSGLRSLIRQDPDIIMVGEIRDDETAKLASKAALTGHLVLSTLHTMDLASTVTRLTDMGVEPFLISSTLNFVIAQRLVRKLTEDKKKYYLSTIEIRELSNYCNLDRVRDLFIKEGVMRESEEIGDIPFYKPRVQASKSGYQGRVGIYEVMKITEKIKEMIIEKADAEKIKKQAQEEGMTTLFEEGLLKAAQGVTSIDEVLRIID